MKKYTSIVLLLFIGTFNLNSQVTLTIGNSPEYQEPNDYTDTYESNTSTGTYTSGFNGFLADIKFKYAFKRCFGDIVMAYGYDLEIWGFQYNRKRYYLKDLGIDDFKKYVTSVEASFKVVPEELNSWEIAVGKDNAVLENFDVGCYGQTFKVASKESQTYKLASSNFFTLHTYVSTKVNFSKTLVYKIENLEKRKKEQKKRSDAYWNTNSTSKKKRITKRKKSYWNN